VRPTPHFNSKFQSTADDPRRFLPYLRRALQSLVRKYEPTYLYISKSYSSAPTASSSSLVTRDFNIAFYNLPLTSGIRDLRMDRIGQLMSISGTVTRTSEVRPELVSGTFVCEGCRATIRDVEQQFKYTEVSPVVGNPSIGNTRLIDPSQHCAKTRHVTIGQGGNSTPSSPSLPTGRKSEFRRTRTRSRPVLCRDRE
jgi:DNA replicative helicase MCM subunit Mcm2 (Cdc46/Mcm family)